MAIAPPIAGQEISAANFGIPVANQLNTLATAVWATYVPIVSQGASSNIGGTFHSARWIRQSGRVITATVFFSCNTPGSASSGIGVTLPVPAYYPSQALAVGVMEWRDSSTAIRYSGIAWLNSATVVVATISGSIDNSVGNAAIINVGDTVNMTVTYESAT